ncbi:aldehyde dehydrogenase [Conyzicola nivalis]|nr:aldehyde dehydrogenase [Conyzicola nivalis]
MTTEKMMTMMPMEMSMDMKLMQQCIEACAAAEQAATMCADAAMGEGMAKMMSMCANTADMTHTMMRMMMRPTGYDMASMMGMLEATMMMCRACATECMMHADMSDHCAMCAEVCTNAVTAMEELKASMPVAG